MTFFSYNFFSYISAFQSNSKNALPKVSLTPEYLTFLSIFWLIVCLCMATLAEGFPCSFLSCKANARVKPVKTGHGPHSSKFLCCSIYFFVLSYLFLCCSMYCFVSFTVLFVCICVLYDWHRVATQLQLTNISYHYFLNNVIEQKCVSGFSLQL